MKNTSNPLINKFNAFSQNTRNNIPFQNNKLITENVHIGNDLNNIIRSDAILHENDNVPTAPKRTNIIEDILKPIKLTKFTTQDLDIIYKNRQLMNSSQNNEYKITNVPYKNIIKDKILTKRVEDIRPEDLIVHQVIEGVDNNIEIFKRDMSILENELQKINDDISLEYCDGNREKHKKKFGYNETFIRNLAYEQKSFDDNKQDYLEFYKKKQKEIENGLVLCDQVIKNLIDEGCICSDELPFNSIDNQ